jgi:tetratricopeptide (TPR) repeat protein
VAFTDEQTGRLLDDLAARRGDRGKLVVVAADHGEGLDEHGESTHGALLHTSTIRVPIVVRRPAYAPRVLTAPLALERVPATVLAAVGLDPSLNPGAAPRLGDPPTPVHAETLYPYYNFGWAGLRVREENGWRLIAGPVDRLYRVTDDPGEARDLAGQHPDLVAALRHSLESEWADRRSRAFETERRPLSDADTEALRALGYVAGAAPASADPDTPFLADGDPESRMELVDVINRGLTLLAEGDAEGAVAILRRVALEDPGNRFAQQYLGQAAMQAGHLEESRGAFRTALRLGPNPYPVYRDLAWVHAALGDTAAARETLLESIALNPDSADARVRLAMMLVGEGRLEEAAELLRAAAELRPRQADVWSGLATVSRELGRRDEAADCYRRVLELDDEGPLADDARRRLQELGASAEARS